MFYSSDVTILNNIKINVQLILFVGYRNNIRIYFKLKESGKLISEHKYAERY